MTFTTIIATAYLCDYAEGVESHNQFSPPEKNEKNRDKSTDHQHYFCGQNYISGAWCPNCNKPLLRLLLIDASDFRLHLEIDTITKVPLLYCWTCSISQNFFSYQIIDDNRVVLISFNEGEPETDFPYNNYPVWFPGASMSLVEIPPDAQNMIYEMNRGLIKYSLARKKYPDLITARHQIGGEPLLMQRNPDYQEDKSQRAICPRCSENAPFLAEVGNDCLDVRGIIGNDYVQILFHLCVKCRVIVAFNQTD